MPESSPPSSDQSDLLDAMPEETAIGPGVYLSELPEGMQEATDLDEGFHRHADRLLNPPWLARVIIGACVWVLETTIYRNPKPDRFGESKESNHYKESE